MQNAHSIWCFSKKQSLFIFCPHFYRFCMMREGRSVSDPGSPLDPGGDEHSLRHRTGKSLGNMRGGSDQIVLKVQLHQLTAGPICIHSAHC